MSLTHGKNLLCSLLGLIAYLSTCCIYMYVHVGIMVFACTVNILLTYILCRKVLSQMLPSKVTEEVSLASFVTDQREEGSASPQLQVLKYCIISDHPVCMCVWPTVWVVSGRW